VKRFGVLTFGAVILATAILAVLGYVSLRQWEASAELPFREQARDMAAMAAEKVEMAILKSEEERARACWPSSTRRGVPSTRPVRSGVPTSRS